MDNRKDKLVSFDMDMTLLNHADFKIPQSALRAINRMRNHCYIVIATGRDLDASYSAGLADPVRPDAIIYLNGNKITVGDELIFEHCMDRDLVIRLLRFAEGKKFALGLTTGSEDYYVNPEYVVRQDEVRFGISERNFCDPWKLPDMPVRTMAYIGDERFVPEIEAAFPELKLPLFSSRMGADVIEKKASKAEGLKRLCAYYGLSLADTVAFGDSMNDIEIIRTAGIGVAMGNSVDALKEAADYVTAPVGEDGVWKACEHLGLI